MGGPAFSTVAESNMYRSWNASVIGMTQVQEAKLCREAEISYAVCALATDYDCWRSGHDAVTVEEVVSTMKRNVVNARAVLKAVVPRIAAYKGSSPMSNALAGAIQTAPDAIPKERAAELAPLIGKYIKVD